VQARDRAESLDRSPVPAADGRDQVQGEAARVEAERVEGASHPL
jgi:hypothetical protein